MSRNIFQLMSVGVLLFCSAQSIASEGVIPEVSDHYKAMPMFYDLNRMPVEQLTSNFCKVWLTFWAICRRLCVSAHQIDTLYFAKV